MSNVFQFPDLMSKDVWVNPYEEGALSPPLLGLPRMEVIDRVFEFNFEMLGVDDAELDVDCVEFFTDNEYPGKVLVDIDSMPHRPDIRGLYFVDLNCFELRFISDKPLRHFV